MPVWFDLKGVLLEWLDAEGQPLPKDVKSWRRKMGMYSEEWLVKSVLGYSPLWGEHCGIVPAV